MHSGGELLCTIYALFSSEDASETIARIIHSFPLQSVPDPIDILNLTCYLKKSLAHIHIYDFLQN